MIIKRVEIRRLRCILEETLDCESLTALVGKNGAGKSCFLHALRLFYAVSPVVTEEDFYNRDTTREIEIRVTFGALLAQEIETFGAYVENDELIVTKRISSLDGKVVSKTYGASRQHASFAEVRALASKSERKDAFNRLVDEDPSLALTRVRSADEAEQKMKAWEVEHPDRCVPIEREAQFIGPTTIGVGSLDSYTKFVFIPAVRDVGDETADGKGSALSALLAMVVNERIEARPDLAALKSQLADRYLEIFGPDNQPELRTLEAELTNTLSSFHPGSQVRLDWGNAQAPTIPLPAVVSSLVEDGFAGHVSRKGHGLQRALILSLLQTRASLGRRAGQQVEEAAGGQATSQRLILAIEEPELYQHPQQCRHWASVLRRMTTATTNAQVPHTQVIFTTHSPHFVDLAWFDQVRVVRKSSGGTDSPQVARISSASIAEVGRELADAAAVPLDQVTEQSTRARYRPVMTSMVNEGFFSGVAVLVEGGTEVGLLTAVAGRLARAWDSRGISVIDVGGKGKLDKPLAIFRRLGIPTYVIFDGDANSNNRGEIGRNRLLLRLLGATVEDYPATSHSPTYAVMRENCERVLKSALPEGIYDTFAGAVAMELGYSGAAQAMKNVDCASLFVTRIYEAGHTLQVIEGIVERISALAQPTAVLPPR